jgi:outer membrane receptor for ferrienterochelin and colicin
LRLEAEAEEEAAEFERQQAMMEAEAEARRVAIAEADDQKLERLERKKLKNSWTGWYQQGGTQHEMKFEVLKINKKKIRGEGHDENGQFEIKGKISHDEVKFTKQYHGAHAVEYSGKLEGHKLHGYWSIPSLGMQDAFEITRLHSGDGSSDSAESD